jgi:carboxypeptidase Taq
MEAKLAQLKAHYAEYSDLASVGALLDWDQQTLMPHGGGPARARQAALMGRLAHEKLTDPAFGRLLDDLQPYVDTLPYDHDDAALVRVARREYERAVKVPPAFVAKMYAHANETFQAWEKARPANDFAAVRPLLEKTLDITRQYAGYFAPFKHIMDPLIDQSDYGMSVATIQPVFRQLQGQLAPLVEAVTAAGPIDDACLKQTFPDAQQWQFGLQVAQGISYDFERGRLDRAAHPFTTKFSLGDVRTTTRVREHDLGEALFSTIHECGHAMYEQGINPAYEATALGGGTSSGVHESQSRLWENIVGRGIDFWHYYYPHLQQVFPQQLGPVPLETFHRAINKVQRSLIRTDADELTYNLHVMIRFGLEADMLEGRLAVKDLPDAWNAAYKRDLGIEPPDDRDGVLQDVHWYGMRIGGMFQGYTLGNIMSAMFFDAALKAHPEIPAQMREGRFDMLLGWLRENIYQYGSKFTAAELVQRVTGGGLTIEPYIDYLRTKYEGM